MKITAAVVIFMVIRRRRPLPIQRSSDLWLPTLISADSPHRDTAECRQQPLPLAGRDSPRSQASKGLPASSCTPLSAPKTLCRPPPTVDGTGPPHQRFLNETGEALTFGLRGIGWRLREKR